MIEKLIEFALTNRLLTAAAVVGIACLGLWSMLNISVDSFPDVSNVQVQILTEPESMATEEVEKLITFPIETGMNGLPKITKVRSNSSFGLSVVTVIFEDDADVYLGKKHRQFEALSNPAAEGFSSPDAWTGGINFQ